MEQNNMMHLNNKGFAYDGFFRYSGVSLYLLIGGGGECYFKYQCFNSISENSASEKSFCYVYK